MIKQNVPFSAPEITDPVVVLPRSGNDGWLARVKLLSARERAVFSMLGEGVDMSEIATRFGISVKTIETYRARIKQKLEIENRAKLLTLAVEWNVRERMGLYQMADDGNRNGDGNGHAEGSIRISNHRAQN